MKGFMLANKKNIVLRKILIISSKKVNLQKFSQHALDTNLEVMGQMIVAPTGQV